MPLAKTLPLVNFFSSLRKRAALGFTTFTFAAAMISTPCGAGEVKEVHSISDYWNLIGEQKDLAHPFAFDCIVTYFDPEWKMLFVADMAGTPAYMPYGENFFPFKPGTRIHISGTTNPSSSTLSLDRATVTQVGEGSVAPVSMRGRVHDFGNLNARVVTGSGFVDHSRRLDPRHLELSLSVEGTPVTVWVQLEPGLPVPSFNGSSVRFTGVYNPRFGPDGGLSALEIMVPSASKIELLNKLEDEAGFQLPLKKMGDLRFSPAEVPVRIRGRVISQDPRHYVRLRDEGGQIEVESAQSRTYMIGETVEAFGTPRFQGTDWYLKGALHRSVGFTPQGPQEELHLAADVKDLSPAQAEKGTPVKLTAVVTWSHPDFPFFFVQDSSGGLRINRSSTQDHVRSIGRTLEISGITKMGSYAPEVAAKYYDKVGETTLPVAKPISLEHALTGAEEAQWVEMRGYVSEITKEKGLPVLKLSSNSGSFESLVATDDSLDSLVGSFVRIDGVCHAVADTSRQLKSVRLWVPNSTYVQTEEEAPKDPFVTPVQSILSLGQFGSLPANTRRVHVTGVVAYCNPGDFMVLIEGNQSARVTTRDRTRFEPGTRVSVVGILGRRAAGVSVREAVVRTLGKGETIAVISMENEAIVNPDWEDHVVGDSVTLLQKAKIGSEWRLAVSNTNLVYEVIAGEGSGYEGLAALQPGSKLSVQGLCQVNKTESGTISGLKVLLRAPSDVRVLATPSWFNRDRIIAFTAVLVGCILAFVAWVASLRKRVRQQTKRIKDQLHRESFLEAELQRHSKLESLGLLAGGIAHDFNNLLTVMIGNLSLARLDEGMSPESAASLSDAEKAADRARDLTMQLLTFSKGGAPIRSAVSIADVVREVVEFTLRGSNLKCHFEIAPDLWQADADRGQIAQVVQNIVINSMQATPGGGVLMVSARNEDVGRDYSPILKPGRYVRIALADTGPGIPKKDLAHVFDPYFTTKKDGNGLGLATVYSIVKKHEGHITASSVEGQGTTITIWLPSASATPAVPSASKPPLPTQLQSPSRVGKVLLMDDEPQILQVAVAMLHRRGHEVVPVRDGSEAVNEYLHALQVGKPFDAVILDLTVPGGVGGKQALEQLRVLDPNVCAIVSSGYSHDGIVADHLKHGFQGRVLKPYEMDDLLLEVDRVLQVSHRSAENDPENTSD